MSTSTKKQPHKSRWKVITVLDNDMINNYKLNEKGRLSTSFEKQKYRKISKYYKMLESSIEKPQNTNLLLHPDENKKILPTLTIENICTYDSNENDSDIIEEYGSIEYYNFLTKL